MKVLIAAAAAMSIVAVAGPAAAQVYGTIGYSSFESESVKLPSVTLRLGYDTSTPFGVEAEYSTGLQNDKTIELDNEYAIYGTGKIKRENYAIFARVGWGAMRAGTSTAKQSQNSANYGVGGEWFVDKNGLRVDYTRHDFSSGEFPDFNVYTFSYIRKF